MRHDLTCKPIYKILDNPPPVGTLVLISAWVKQIRLAGGGNMLFIHLGDGHSHRTLQVVYDLPVKQDHQEPEETDTEEWRQITFESAISVEGEMVESPASGQAIEIKASKITLIGGCDQDKYPFVRGKKAFPMEHLRKWPHLRPKTGVFGAIMRVRDALSFATIQFYRERDFYWVHTPILTTSDCEGAGETFHVTVDKEPKFFRDQQAYLTVSGQLQLEPFACGLSKVFVFGPSFRAEKSATNRHLSEFWMLEPEVAFQDLHQIIDLAEEYIKYAIKYCLTHRRDELELLSKVFKKKDLISQLEKTCKSSDGDSHCSGDGDGYSDGDGYGDGNGDESRFAQVTYRQAVKILQDSKQTFEKPSIWGVDFGSDQERYLCEEFFKRPTFITHYPSKIKAFYMYEDNAKRYTEPDLGKDYDPTDETVACMDLLMPGIGEVVGGSQREHRLEILEHKVKEAGLDKEQYGYYLDTRRFGSIPHSGFGVGFDRLLRFITGAEHIMDVVPYPVRFEHI